MHAGAAADLGRLDHAVQACIRRAVYDLEKLDDPRQRLVPYAENLKGYWKLRVGDYRLVCELHRDDRGQLVIIIHVVHRRDAYRGRSVRTIRRRSED